MKRIEILERERENLTNEIVSIEKKLVKEKNEQNLAAMEKKLRERMLELKEVGDRLSRFSIQARIVECDDKPMEVHVCENRGLEDELKHAYCAKCTSPNLKITKIIQIECRQCGRKRLITTRMDESKR
ncbi:MAG: hypothetical protein NTV88_00960 [Candidatus Micrarchaeota archaeon]|nr:hypothetical protein [Candidatus Micrarchaeota archaeon]